MLTQHSATADNWKIILRHYNLEEKRREARKKWWWAHRRRRLCNLVGDRVGGSQLPKRECIALNWAIRRPDNMLSCWDNRTKLIDANENVPTNIIAEFIFSYCSLPFHVEAKYFKNSLLLTHWKETSAVTNRIQTMLIVLFPVSRFKTLPPHSFQCRGTSANKQRSTLTRILTDMVLRIRSRVGIFTVVDLRSRHLIKVIVHLKQINISS